MRLHSALLVAVFVALAAAGHAQPLPTGPVSTLDGRLSIGAEVVGTVGARDSVAFFNYTDYERNALRLFRLALSADWHPVEPIAFVAELRTEDLEDVRPYAAYVRIRPWRTRGFDVQAGRIPPVFGAFGRRTYQTDNPVIGYPLAYQYLTSLRADSVPASLDELLRMRGRGWRTGYTIGDQTPAPGVPLVSTFRWDTGVQARWRGRRVQAAAAVTTGTLSDPRVDDNNDGKQVSARVAVQPIVGLILGGSAARGRWLDEQVLDLLPRATAGHQTALGLDAEYSRDYWILRGELVWSRWGVPVGGAGSRSLDALGAWIEGRYRLTPRIFAAGRLDRLGFAALATDTGPVPWDAPVTRVEIAAGYYLQRNLTARLAIQHNERSGGRIPSRTFVSGQVAYWF